MAVVLGGEANRVTGAESAIAGGGFNVASGIKAWVGGGEENVASGRGSAVFGGHAIEAASFLEAEPQSSGTPFTAEETALLKEILPHLAFKAKGVGAKPTVQFTGTNVQITSGAKESEVNGLGNLVVGANESPGAQSGSNNLVLGSIEPGIHELRRTARRR